MSDLWTPIVIVVLLLLAAFASVAHTAIGRMNRVRALHLVQEKRKGADALMRIAEDPAPFTNVVLLVMLAAQVTASVLAAAVAIDRYDGFGPLVAAVVMTLLIFVVAQVVPATYSVQRTDRAALAMARPVLWTERVLRPLGKILIWVANALLTVLPGQGMPKGPFVTEEEIRHMIDVAEEEEEIEEEERELIHSIFEFGDTVVREVMVPRPDMVTVRSDATLEAGLDVVLQAGFSRIPIYEGDNDNIVGVLYAKDLMKRMHEGGGAARVMELARPPAFVPEQKKVRELLREMQEQRVHMAVVVDEYGGTAGLVTIEDLIEEIVGEIVDEYDQEEALVEPLGDGTFRVDAKMPIDEVNELLNVELPHEEWDTVGGLVFGLIGRVPVPGETVGLNGVAFRTERVTGRRIQKVVIEKLPVEESEESPS